MSSAKIAPKPWPRLSETLTCERRPDRCQGCGAPGLDRYQECDEWDRPEPIVVVLCRGCSKRLIDPHPRLYRTIWPFTPLPGVLQICIDCIHRQGTRCGHPHLKANGGPGLALKVPQPTRAHLNYGGGRGEWRDMYPHEPRECAGRETPA